MRKLIVIANPEAKSLTHYAVERFGGVLPADSYEVVDLSSEKFDARCTLADREAYQSAENYPADLRREHERLERD